MNITTFTIAYNDYGKFLPQWIDNIKKQDTKVEKIIIVLGKKHGANIKKLEEQLKDIDYEIIKSKSSRMGTLRNEAIRKIKTEWMLYFSADDELMPNAITEIEQKSKDNDVIALRYIDVDVNGGETPRESAIIPLECVLDWKKEYMVPGYIAVKRKHNNRILYYENIEIPNYPYLFLLASKGLKMANTDQVCAMYRRRKHSHGDLAIQNNKFIDYSIIIDESAKHYLKKGCKKVLVKVKVMYDDVALEQRFTYDDEVEMSIERAIYLSEERNFVDILKIVK